MALYRGTKLNFRTNTRDVVFGTDVRALANDGNGTPGTSFTMTWTSTTGTFRTADPYTNTTGTANADNPTNLGWGMNQNEASLDGVGATATRKRVIPAGTWQFGIDWTSNAAAQLASYDVTIDYKVHRVAANGGARTLIFDTAGVSVNVSSLAAGSGDGIVNHAGAPLIVLEPNETIMVAFNVFTNATANVLGQVTNTVITFAAASGFVTLPSPGMRDLNIDSNTAIGKGAGSKALLTRKDVLTAIGEGAGSHDYIADFFRAFNAIGEGLATRQQLTVMKTAAAIGEGAGTRSLFVRKDLLNAIGEGDGYRSLLLRKGFLEAIGEGSGSLQKLALHLRMFAAIGEGAAAEDETVIFVRMFEAIGKATIRPRIALDWDDLPDPGGGGGTTVIRRPTFVFGS